MSNVESNKPVEQDGMPTWDERNQFSKVQRWFRFLVAVVVILWLLLIVWDLFFARIQKANVLPLAPGANLTLVLAPLLVASVVVERVLESIFNVIEGSWYTMVAYLGGRLSWLKSAEFEFKQARQFLADLTKTYNAEMKSMQIGQTSVSVLREEIARMEAANRMIALARTRLADTESNLAEARSTDSYISVKSAASIVIGFTLGAIIATLGELQIFALLGVGAVPAPFDVLVSGLAIGSGSYIVHLLIGVLQQGKDTLDSVKGYFNRSAPSVQDIEQRITTVEAPVYPVEPVVAETTTANPADEGPYK